MTRTLMSALMALALVACVGEGDEGEPLDRETVEEAKADGLDICWMVGLEAGCDLCAELDWYGDGVCDSFCDEPDPDCACGGFAGLTCEAGTFCDYPDDASCGIADMTGVCRRMPGDCTYAAMEPVCGCDGETYPSACHANINGVDVMNLGGCVDEEEPTDCRDDGCGDDDECQYCWGTWQCIPEGAVC